MATRFREDQVRPTGRDTRGVRGITLRDGDSLVGMAVFPRDGTASLLTVAERGYGKRTDLAVYPTKRRAGVGVITIKTSERNGKVVAVRVVSDEDHLIVITDRGKIIRVPVAGVPILGRATQGVRIMRVEDGEKVSSVERLADPEDHQDIEVATPEAAPPEPEEAEAEEEDTEATDDEPGDDT
jgi:DNA gyrase subunit A